MIEELVGKFGEAYKQAGDALITDSYVMKTGIYIRIDDKGNIKDRQIYNRKDGRIDNESYDWFAKRDYLSDLLDMNKAIDPKKKIHSNNFLSFYIKKDTVIGNKKISKDELNERIKEYYKILLNPMEKYAGKKKSRELYHSIGDKVDQNLALMCKELMIKHLDRILKEIEPLAFDNYVKIFIDQPIEKYEIESKRYIIPNIYNSNEYNIRIGHAIYGLTNQNMGLNSKKPYLEHKTMDNSIPYRVKSDQIILHKKFFDWLATKGSGSLYISEDSDFVCKLEHIFKPSGYGQYLLELEQGKTPLIKNYTYIPFFKKEVMLVVKNIQGVREKDGDTYYLAPDRSLTLLEDIAAEIDDLWFQKQLRRHYFSEPKDMKNMKADLKQMILSARSGCYATYREAKENRLSLVTKYGIQGIIAQLKEGYTIKAAKGMNLYIALKMQEEGSKKMGDKIIELRDNLRQALTEEVTVGLESDALYYYLSGQIVRYLLNQSEAKNPKQSLVNPFLNINKNSRLVKEIQYIYVKYNHAIPLHYKKFNHAFAMLQGYEPQSDKLDKTMFLAGFTASNILYENEKGDK